MIADDTDTATSMPFPAAMPCAPFPLTPDDGVDDEHCAVPLPVALNS
jgi:hypothetical protein